MKIDYTKSYLSSNEIPSLTPASMSGGGKKIKGGAYTGVSFLPQRPIGGMLGRMGYGPHCTPVFYGDLYNMNGGGKNNKKCDCEKEIHHTSLLNELYKKVSSKSSKSKMGNITQMGGMTQMGGSDLLTQFTAISKTAPLFATWDINNIIALIILIFGHSYVLQYANKKDSNKKKILSGGYNNKKIIGGSPLGSILAPLGMSNLIALASLLLLHYFVVRRKRMSVISGGGLESLLNENVFDKEMKIHEMLGGYKIYNQLEEVFLKRKDENIIYGGCKNSFDPIITHLGYDSYMASGILRMLKTLFSNFYNSIYNKENKKKSYGKITFRLFKRIFNILTPVSVAIYLKKNKVKVKKNKKI